MNLIIGLIGVLVFIGFILLAIKLTKQQMAGFKSEDGEKIITDLGTIWVDSTTLTESRKSMKMVLITDKALVISKNTLGGYPGFRVFFDKQKDPKVTKGESVLESFLVNGNEIEIKSRGFLQSLNFKVEDSIKLDQLISLLPR